MKTGFIKPRTDLAIKHITFVADGKKHFISFRFSHRKGISDVHFDGQEAEVTDAYPPLTRLIQECASVIIHDLHVFVRKIAHERKNHIL